MKPGLYSENKVMDDEVRRLRDDVLASKPELKVSKVVEDERHQWLHNLASGAGGLAFFPVRNATLPVIDSIGVRAWENMLRHTETMFDRTRTQRSNANNLSLAQKRDVESYNGAMAMFMNQLCKLSQSQEVTLVGHSMGAIVSNRILVDYPIINCRNIVYMGAACSVRDFESSVVPYLRSNPDCKFYNLCLHPQRETGEAALKPGGVSIPIASRGSLLVWIDNIFGQPPSEKQRRFGVYQTALVSNRSIPEKVRSQITFKCFPLAKDESGKHSPILKPQHHGDFSLSPYWDPTFWKVDVFAEQAASIR